MGFLTKAWNWVRGKGFKEEKEEVEQEIIKQTERIEEPTTKRKEIKEERKIKEEEKKEEKIILTKEKEKSEMEKFRERIKRQPLKKEIEGKINKEIVNRINITQTQGDIGKLKPLYTEIFTKDAKLTDPDILDVLIDNRKQLQHRFEATFTIFYEKGIAGTMRTTGILIEHTNDIYRYITIGQEIDYLTEALEAAQNHFEQNYGAIGGNIKVEVTKKIKITNIEIDVSYA